MTKNCNLLTKLEVKNFGHQEHFICPSDDPCPHDKRRSIGSSHICNMDPYSRTAVIHSEQPIETETDVNKFFASLSRHKLSTRDYVINYVSHEIETNSDKCIPEDTYDKVEYPQGNRHIVDAFFEFS